MTVWIYECGRNSFGLADKAVQHTAEMKRKFARQIAESTERTVIYDEHFSLPVNETGMPDVIVEDLDSVSAVTKYSTQGVTTVLNFADYKYPGGLFLEGGCTQEECLCHASFLFNVLVRFKEYYGWNAQHSNQELYTNRALFTPDIIFQQDGNSFKCNVLTCAAPNRYLSECVYGTGQKKNTEELFSRIKFVLDIAAANRTEFLILGAFGCGAFGQEAAEVADIFCQLLQGAYSCFRKVVFAVPAQIDFGNWETFYYAFCK